MNFSQFKPFFMWLFPLSFFAYQFVLRLWPGLMMPQMMQQFSIDASGFGVLAAFYYFGYSGMQIPVAILLDRLSIRSVVCTFSVMCGMATLLFTYTDSFYLAAFSRFLVGAGSALGFLGVSKVISEWFPKEKYASMVGLSFSFGLTGALYGGKPVSLLIDHYSGQSVATTLAFLSILIGLGSYALLRSPKQLSNLNCEEKFKLTSFKFLFSSPILWCLALANLLMVGSLEGFADVWGVPYLMATYNVTKSQAAGLVSFIFFGMLFGGPLLALLSKKLGNYAVIALCGCGMSLAFATLLFNSQYSPFLLSGLFFMIGVFCCYQVIVFAAGSNLVPSKNLGVTVAFLNCVNMLGGSFFHTTIGKIMDLYWTGAFDASGLKTYDPQVYTYALSLIPTCALIGASIVCMLALKNRKLQTRNMQLA